MREYPALYEVAKMACHQLGLPWTDPRTGETFQPPKKSKKRKRAKARPRTK
jgi:hypothetical protein